MVSLGSDSSGQSNISHIPFIDKVIILFIIAVIMVVFSAVILPIMFNKIVIAPTTNRYLTPSSP